MRTFSSFVADLSTSLLYAFWNACCWHLCSLALTDACRTCIQICLSQHYCFANNICPKSLGIFWLAKVGLTNTDHRIFSLLCSKTKVTEVYPKNLSGLQRTCSLSLVSSWRNLFSHFASVENEIFFRLFFKKFFRSSSPPKKTLWPFLIERERKK